jgi:hypothetical protein
VLGGGWQVTDQEIVAVPAQGLWGTASAVPDGSKIDAALAAGLFDIDLLETIWKQSRKLDQERR